MPDRLHNKITMYLPKIHKLQLINNCLENHKPKFQIPILIPNYSRIRMFKTKTLLIPLHSSQTKEIINPGLIKIIPQLITFREINWGAFQIFNLFSKSNEINKETLIIHRFSKPKEINKETLIIHRFSKPKEINKETLIIHRFSKPKEINKETLIIHRFSKPKEINKETLIIHRFSKPKEINKETLIIHRFSKHKEMNEEILKIIKLYR